MPDSPTDHPTPEPTSPTPVGPALSNPEVPTPGAPPAAPFPYASTPPTTAIGPRNAETAGFPPPIPAAPSPQMPGPQTPGPQTPSPHMPGPHMPSPQTPSPHMPSPQMPSPPAAGAPGVGRPGWSAPGAEWAGAPGGGWTHGTIPPPGWRPDYVPPKPKLSRAAVIVTIVAVVVVLACLSFGTVVFFTLRHDDSLDRATGRPGSSPTAFPLPSAPSTEEPGSGGEQTHDGDIKQFVVERPAGARAWPKVSAEQTLDLNAAAAGLAKPSDGKVVLQRLGYEDGYTRRWIDDQGDYVTVRVLRFLTASGGDNFTNFFIDATQGAGWGDPQPVPGIDTAAMFIQPKPAANGLQRSLAVGAAGDIVAIVLADQPPPAKASVPDAQLADEFALL